MTLIVAVFGGSNANDEVLKRAAELGTLLAQQGCIVLTGAGIDESEKSVKGAAISQLGENRWIGVDRTQTPNALPNRNGFVLSPAIDHKRNYVEACISQAAICLPGQAGTRSEAAFALALQRPVVFWGDEWKQDSADSVIGSKGNVNVKLLVDAALVTAASCKPLKVEVDKAIEEAWSHKWLTERLASLPACRWFASDKQGKEVVSWLLEQLRNMHEPPRSFIPTLPHADLDEKLTKWLKSGGHDALPTPRIS